MQKGLPTQPQQDDLRSLRQHNTSCCNLRTALTMTNSDLRNPLIQPAMRSFMTLITVLSLSTYTRSECRTVINKSSMRANCTTCCQSSNMACTYLPRHERESFWDSCWEWHCHGTISINKHHAKPKSSHNQSNAQEHDVTRATKKCKKMGLPPDESFNPSIVTHQTKS